jgi:hypothetical protein
VYYWEMFKNLATTSLYVLEALLDLPLVNKCVKSHVPHLR